MRKHILTLLVFLLAAPLANAGDALYNFVEAGYLDHGNIGDGVSGLQARASYEITDTVFVQGGHQALSDDIDYDASYIGVFTHWFIEGGGGFFVRPSSLYLGLTMERNEFSGSGWSIDDTAPGVRLGMREFFSDQFEMALELRHVTGDLDYTGARWAAHFTLTPALDFNVGLDYISSSPTSGNNTDASLGIAAGLRYSY